MGTQGVVSVTRDGRTIIKVVAGCQGYMAEELAQVIKERRLPLGPEQVQRWAQIVGFGCPNCLVVMDEQEALGQDADELPALYRQTFDDPRFNPRWQRGTASHVEVVEIGEGGKMTRFISRERYDLLRRLIEQCTTKRLEVEGVLPALYVSYAAERVFWKGRAYLVDDAADERIEPVFRKRVVYRPVPENEREE